MMKKAVVVLFLLTAALVKADEYQTEPLAVSKETVYIVSTFEELDYFTAFSPAGTILWEIPFSSKIQSWKIDSGQLYIFSKMRRGQVYFLSCFGMDKGELLWEKPIIAPQNQSEPQMLEHMASELESAVETAPQ
jgi:outer membrane protein assembly factor BamB